MTVAELFQLNADAQIRGDAQTLIEGLSYDSRSTKAGDLFFALPGAKVDGRQYIESAIAAGAIAVVHQGEVALPVEVIGVQVPNARQAMAEAAACFFGRPADRMLVIGVTGTNGKTTVTTLLEQVLTTLGRKPAVVGTIAYRFGEETLPSPHTTPESVDLIALAADFQAKGADTLILEVSSHALEQHRVDGLRFDAALFTNLTPEHLDYHGDMEGYFASKARLFSDLMKVDGQMIVNQDDPFGERLKHQHPSARTFGVATPADVRAVSAEQSLSGINAEIRINDRSFDLQSPLVGTFNLSNLLAVIATATALGHSAEAVCQALTGAVGAAGRMERVATNCDALVLVDYAHTGDALENALKAVQAMQPKRILTLFGCGGDRDTRKRPVMGQIAGRYSDLVVLTSDNPRSEDPQQILAQVEQGLQQELSALDSLAEAERGYLVCEDRGTAIRRAVEVLQPGDVLLVAGKGHEDYQILAQGRIHFDDREQLRDALRHQGKSA